MISEVEKMGHALEFSDTSFKEDVLESDVPVLVDFWAPWCGPCRQIAPLIEELAKNYEGTAKVGKVNVDENPGVAQEFGIIPSRRCSFSRMGTLPSVSWECHLAPSLKQRCPKCRHRSKLSKKSSAFAELFFYRDCIVEFPTIRDANGLPSCWSLKVRYDGRVKV